MELFTVGAFALTTLTGKEKMNGTEFRNMRLEKGYERRDVGEALDRNKDTVRAWESGRSPVPKFAADWLNGARYKDLPTS